MPTASLDALYVLKASDVSLGQGEMSARTISARTSGGRSGFSCGQYDISHQESILSCAGLCVVMFSNTNHEVSLFLFTAACQAERDQSIAVHCRGFTDDDSVASMVRLLCRMQILSILCRECRWSSTWLQ